MMDDGSLEMIGEIKQVFFELSVMRNTTHFSRCQNG